MIGRSLITDLVIVLVVLVLAANVRADAAELWRDTPGDGDCRLELINEFGDVRLAASPRRGLPARVQGDPTLVVESAGRSDHPVLTVARGGAPDEQQADVEVLVPPGCIVEVRTGAGAVQIDVSRHAFSVDISTITGDITACIDPHAVATIRFATSGEITTDFTVEVDLKYHVEPAKHGYIKLDDTVSAENASGVVQLNSRRGAVRMLRCLEDGRAQQPETPDGEPAKEQ